MPELPDLTPEHFEILVVRELRKVGLDVSELRIHRRTTLPEPERGYLLELTGVLSGPAWRRQALVACRRQQAPIGRAAVESLRAHVTEAGAEARGVFGTAHLDAHAPGAGPDGALAPLPGTHRRTARDTSRWGAPRH